LRTRISRCMLVLSAPTGAVEIRSGISGRYCRDMALDQSITVEPLTTVNFPMLGALFRDHDVTAGCWCMWFIIPVKNSTRPPTLIEKVWRASSSRKTLLWTISLSTKDAVLAGVQQVLASAMLELFERRPKDLARIESPTSGLFRAFSSTATSVAKALQSVCSPLQSMKLEHVVPPQLTASHSRMTSAAPAATPKSASPPCSPSAVSPSYGNRRLAESWYGSPSDLGIGRTVGGAKYRLNGRTSVRGRTRKRSASRRHQRSDTDGSTRSRGLCKLPVRGAACWLWGATYWLPKLRPGSMHAADGACDPSGPQPSTTGLHP
jgi:hypothetical protein